MRQHWLAKTSCVHTVEYYEVHSATSTFYANSTFSLPLKSPVVWEALTPAAAAQQLQLCLAQTSLDTGGASESKGPL